MHCCQFTEMTDTNWFHRLQAIFTCFMAWFFFKSGMFHRVDIKTNVSLKHAVKKLLPPYLFFLIVGHIVHCLFLFLKHDTNWIHYILSPIKECLLGNGSHAWALHLWFLITLLEVKILCCKIIKNNTLGIIFALLGCITAWISNHYITIRPFYIVNIFPALFFYFLGYKMREKQFNKWVFYLSLVIFALSMAYPSHVNFMSNKVEYGLYMIWLLYASAGIIVFNNIGKMINITVFPFTKIGEKSMYYFLIHWIFLCCITETINLSKWNIERGQYLAITTVLLAIMLVSAYPLFYKTRLKQWINL